MSRKTIELVVDDLDGTVLEPDEGTTVTFGLAKRTYEIDLSGSHAQELHDALAPYLRVARSVKGQAPSRARSADTRQRSGYKLSEIRRWAQENGHDVPARGRVSNVIIDAYNAAH